MKTKPCQTCGHNYSLRIGDFTHNCNEMMRRAMDAVGTLALLGEHHLYNLQGMTGAAAAELLVPAMEWWKQNRDAMADLVPENGWGSEASALDFWGRVAKACVDHPDGTLEMNG